MKPAELALAFMILAGRALRKSPKVLGPVWSWPAPSSGQGASWREDVQAAVDVGAQRDADDQEHEQDDADSRTRVAERDSLAGVVLVVLVGGHSHGVPVLVLAAFRDGSTEPARELHA